MYTRLLCFCAHNTYCSSIQYANRKSSLRFPTSVVVARYSAFSYREPSQQRVSIRAFMREWFYVLPRSWHSKPSLFVYSCKYSTASCPDKEWLSSKLRSPSSIYSLVDLSMFCCMESDLEDWRGERTSGRVIRPIDIRRDNCWSLNEHIVYRCADGPRSYCSRVSWTPTDLNGMWVGIHQ